MITLDQIHSFGGRYVTITFCPHVTLTGYIMGYTPIDDNHSWIEVVVKKYTNIAWWPLKLSEIQSICLADDPPTISFDEALDYIKNRLKNDPKTIFFPNPLAPIVPCPYCRGKACMTATTFYCPNPECRGKL